VQLKEVGYRIEQLVTYNYRVKMHNLLSYNIKEYVTSSIVLDAKISLALCKTLGQSSTSPIQF
jgi:hypothetical protein